MVRPTKKEQIPNLGELIKQAAWEQIGAKGASALTLRAVSRQLGISAPAIYHYYPTRDALVTALIIEAYSSLGDSQLQAQERVPPQDLTGGLIAIGKAYRDWALRYPQRYQLIFGNPIPGYTAPYEEVLPAGARSLVALVGVLDALFRNGQLRTAGLPDPLPGAENAFSAWKKFAGDFHREALAAAVIVWSRVHGLVSLELTGNMPPHGMDHGSLYEWELENLAHEWVLPA
jgi:AcrR family transcriptional regulator